MNKVFALFYIVSTVFAVTPETPGVEPLNLETVLKYPVGSPKADSRVAFEVHGTVNVTRGHGDYESLRFLVMRPKVDADLSAGFVTPGLFTPKVLPFSLPAHPGEKLVELFSLSDCKTWVALNLHLWNPLLNDVTAKAAGYVKTDEGWVKHALLPDVVSPLPGLTFFDFVKMYLKFEFVDDLLDLLPSHPVALALAGYLPPAKAVVAELPKVELPVVSAPLDLDKVFDDKVSPALLDARVAFSYHHTAVHSSSPGEAQSVKFLHLVPKLGADLTGGLKGPFNVAPDFKHFTLPTFPGQSLVEFLAFTDSKTWFVAHLELWHPGLGATTHKSVGYVKGEHGWVKHHLYGGLSHLHTGETLVDFVHDRVSHHLVLDLFKGLPSHPLVLALEKKWVRHL